MWNVINNDYWRTAKGLWRRDLLKSVAALTTTVFLVAACGEGGDDDDGGDDDIVVANNNLSVSEVQIMTPDPKIAHPLQTAVAITAERAVNDVSVSLFAIEKVDDPVNETRQFPLGTQTIDVLLAGSGIYEIDVNLPSTIQLPGSYFVSAIVDPVNLIAETNEQDNLASVETEFSPEGPPNIVLEELVLDRLALEINTSTYEEQLALQVGNVHNPDAGATVVVGADGLSENESVELEAFALLRMQRSDRGTSHDVPLYLWNSEEARYMNAYGTSSEFIGQTSDPEWLPVGEFNPQRVVEAGSEAALDDLDRHSILMSFYFPGKLGETLESLMRYPTEFFTTTDATEPPPDLTRESISQLSTFLAGLPSNGISGDESAAAAVLSFDICVDIRSADPDSIEADIEDNNQCSPLMITLPPLPPVPLPDGTPEGFEPVFNFVGLPLLSSEGYSTRGGNSSFGFGMDFSATVSADNRGYVEEYRGAVPVTVFGNTLDLVSISMGVQLVPDYNGKSSEDQSGYQVSLRHLGQMLYSIEVGATSLPALSVSYSKEAPNPEKPYMAFIGPIPVVGGASVAANMGLEYEFVFTENADSCTSDPALGLETGSECLQIKNTLSPFTNIEGTIYAGVGSTAFAAGVEGVITLLDIRFPLSSGIQIDVKDDGFTTDVAEFIITQDTALDFVLTGPRGAINLFAKYTVPAFEECSWGPIPAFCPVLKTLKATKNIIRSPAAFRLSDNLLSVGKQQLDVVVVPGETPGYYSNENRGL